MPYYLLTITFSVLGAILGILSSIFQGGPRKILIVFSIAAFLSAEYDVRRFPNRKFTQTTAVTPKTTRCISRRSGP